MLFGYEEKELAELKAVHTSRELAQQPHFWEVTYEMIKAQEKEIKTFLEKYVTKENRVIFTGAGTSDYIGDTIRSYVAARVDARIEAIATTDIVANPEEIIERDTKTILVSFARSGNSPESVGVYQLFQQKVTNIVQIVITCNKDGDLARLAKENKENYLIVLPEETNDKGFAMTSSFSCMMLSALLFFDIARVDENKKIVSSIIQQGSRIIEEQWGLVKALSDAKPQRVVYLGSGCFHGLVQELSLKNMELTNGEIPSMQESVLGFRHGPKTFMNDTTTLIILMSQNPYTNQYTKDLIRELRSNSGDHTVVVLDYNQDEELKAICDTYIGIGGEKIPEIYTSFLYLLYGQLFALYNSVNRGITPDNPSPDGTVNRVVTGVTLYQYEEEL